MTDEFARSLWQSQKRARWNALISYPLIGVFALSIDYGQVPYDFFARVLDLLSTRANGIVVYSLGIQDLASFMALGEQDLLACRSCGRKTAREVLTMQQRVRDHLDGALPDNLALRIQESRPSLPPMAVSFCEASETGSGLQNGHYRDSGHLFQSVVAECSVRAANTLRDLGVDDIPSLKGLTVERLLSRRGCGRQTAEEIMSLQRRLRTAERVTDTWGTPDSARQNGDKCRWSPEKGGEPEQKQSVYLGVCREAFHAVLSGVSVRARNTLVHLNVNSLCEFMAIQEENLLKTKNCGRKTAREIRALQREIALFVTREQQDQADSVEQRLTGPMLLQCVARSKGEVSGSLAENGLMIEMERPFPWLVSWLKGLTRSERNSEAFMMRYGLCGSPPMRLGEIGEHMGGVSRERARQMVVQVEQAIENSPAQQQRLLPLIEAMASVTLEKGGIVRLRDLAGSVLSTGENALNAQNLEHAWRFVRFLAHLEIWKGNQVECADGTVTHAHAKRLLRLLSPRVVELAEQNAEARYGEGLWSLSVRRLKSVLLESANQQSGFPSITSLTDVLLAQLAHQRKHEIRIRDAVVYSNALWALRWGRFPEAVLALLKSIPEPLHFGEVAESLRKWREIPDDRRVYAVLERMDEALLWERGTYIHRDHVRVPLSLIQDVERWLLSALGQKVPFVCVYGPLKNFQSRCNTAGITSDEALYSCLRESNHKELKYPKYPYIYLSEGYEGRIPLSLALEDYIFEAGGKVSAADLREFCVERLFAKDWHLSIHKQRIANVVTTSNSGYIHTDNLNVDEEGLRRLLEYTKNTLAQKGHCSIRKIFTDRKVSCLSAGIDSPEVLFSLFQLYFGDILALERFPTVALCAENAGDAKGTITANVVLFLKEVARPVSFDELEDHFVDGLGYKPQQINAVARQAEAFLYHRGCVVHADTLQWNAQKQKMLERTASETYASAIGAGGLFGRISLVEECGNLPDLPEGVYWTHPLIADMLTKGGKYHVLGNAGEAFVPETNELGIRCTGDLVAAILEKDWQGAANLSEFSDVLAKMGLVRRRLTAAMLRGQQKVVIDGREIMLKELLPHAQES